MKNKIDYLKCPNCNSLTAFNDNYCKICDFNIQEYKSTQSIIEIFHKETFCEKLIRLFSCDWVLEWFFDKTDNLKTKGTYGKLLSYTTITVCFGIASCGMFFLLGLYYYLLESLGFFAEGGIKLLLCIPLPLILLYFFRKKGFTWCICFITGIITFINLLI